MKKLIAILIVLVLGWYGNQKIRNYKQELPSGTSIAAGNHGRTAPEPSLNSGLFRCDGRIYCSQMTSCDEAKYFLKNCPGTKMDGNRDGVPCERQWCK
ncbi:MAG TPA: DNA-binding protein [Gammaproteobacteria bacterium]|nr:DNA-binding protein [Gammaproteobacteria bacterium]